MTKSPYKIVFDGTIRPGFERAEVMRRFAAAFHLSPDQIERVFTSQSIVLKKNLTRESGEIKQQKLRAIGMEVRLVAADAPLETCEPAVPATARAAQPPQSVTETLAPVSADRLELLPIAEATSSNPANIAQGAKPVGSTKPMVGAASVSEEPPICPKCGYQRREEDDAPVEECPKCGVIYAKAKAASASARARNRMKIRDEDTTQPRQTNAFPVLAAFASLLPLAVLAEYAFGISNVLGNFDLFKRTTLLDSGPSGRLAGIAVALVIVWGLTRVTGIFGMLHTSETQNKVTLGLAGFYILHQSSDGLQTLLSYPASWSYSSWSMMATGVSTALVSACLFVVTTQLLKLSLDASHNVAEDLELTQE